VLSVSDTGVGMDADTQKKIFEPFYTTKEAGSGTGLGLSTVYGIVKQSGGFIWVYSELGQGTIFKIYFPQIGQVADESSTPNAIGEKIAKGSGTILLVEDEESLAQVESEYLKVAGYRVLVANNGAEALRIDNEYGDPIDLVVTDVVLPGIGGRELADQIRSRRPRTKVIFMSGYTSDAALHGEISAGEPFLQKPFTLTTLGKAVQQAISS